MKTEKKIKRWSLLIIVGLFLSGLTAIPVVSETYIMDSVAGRSEWISNFTMKIRMANEEYPFLFYGFGWLAFAHFVLAFLFVGLYKDAIKNEWLVQFGMIVSIAIFPFAFSFGYFRGIPVWWQFIDCSFGVVAFLIFYRINILLNQLKQTI